MRNLSKASAAVIFMSGPLTLSPTVQAQVSAQGISTDQSAAQSATIPPMPPAAFDLTTASAFELEYYGFPPAPPVDSPHYSKWKKLVSAKRITPSLIQTDIASHPPNNVSIKRELSPINAPAPGSPAGQITSVTSPNWSGYVQVGAAGTFKKNNEFVFGEWIVPVAKQADGVCQAAHWELFQWVGFDGFSGSDVLQAGTESDAYCSGGVTTTSYSFWYEWFPTNSVNVSLPVSPGDVVGVEVWYTTAAPYGHALLINETNNTSAAVGFNPPSGTVFQGNTVEWILERPLLNGGYTNLTNYIASAYTNNYAFNASATGSIYYAGVSPGGTTVYSVTMTCPTWSPSSNCATSTPISTPSLEGKDSIWFFNSFPSL